MRCWIVFREGDKKQAEDKPKEVKTCPRILRLRPPRVRAARSIQQKAVDSQGEIHEHYNGDGWHWRTLEARLYSKSHFSASNCSSCRVANIRRIASRIAWSCGYQRGERRTPSDHRTKSSAPMLSWFFIWAYSAKESQVMLQLDDLIASEINELLFVPWLVVHHVGGPHHRIGRFRCLAQAF